MTFKLPKCKKCNGNVVHVVCIPKEGGGFKQKGWCSKHLPDKYRPAYEEAIKKGLRLE